MRMHAHVVDIGMQLIQSRVWHCVLMLVQVVSLMCELNGCDARTLPRVPDPGIY
jgi:hypothetical protein